MEAGNPQLLSTQVTHSEEANDASYCIEQLTIGESLVSESVEVEEEELGEDRIAALHEVVAPFGKKDTPAVLFEAIDYIKFLHNQITYSIQNCNQSYHKKPHPSVQGGLSMEENEIEPTPDLRSRGLCLVPLSHQTTLDGI